MTDVREFNDTSELGELRPIWRSLLSQTPRADFFHSLEWLEVYWKHFQHGQKLRVLLVSESGEAVGILPLVVRHEWTNAGQFRVLTFPLEAWGSFYRPIGPAPQQTLSAGLRYIKGRRRDWNLLELRWLDEAIAADDWIGVTMKQSRFPARRRIQESIAVVDMSGSWEDYWANRKGHWRNNCRRNEKKLAAYGRVEHLRYRPRGTDFGDDDPRWDLHDLCEEIARRSWQGSSTSGTTISHERIRPFLHDVHEAAAKAGCLDLNLLMVDGQPAAFNYNYVYGGYVSGLRLGFDPQFGRCGAGTVLVHRMLHDGFDRGDHVFDFLPGSLQAKRNWHTSLRKSFRYSYYPPHSARAQALRLKRWLFDWMRSPALSNGSKRGQVPLCDAPSRSVNGT